MEDFAKSLTNINGTIEQASSYTDKKIADLIDGAPDTLDTLKEIADELAKDKTVLQALGDKIENDVNAKINELNKQIQNEIENLKKSVADAKSAMASALTQMGVNASDDASFEDIISGIKGIHTNPRIVNLGNITSYNVASAFPDIYKSLTNNNFFFSSVSYYGGAKIYEFPASGYGGDNWSNTVTASLSYNPSNGILTVNRPANDRNVSNKYDVKVRTSSVNVMMVY